MSKENFNDHCKECEPVLVDVDTGKILSESHPSMQLVKKIWGTTTLEERRAFHRLTCENSRDPEVLKLVAVFQERLSDALMEVHHASQNTPNAN